jgi:hypothetical protein
MAKIIPLVAKILPFFTLLANLETVHILLLLSRTYTNFHYLEKIDFTALQNIFRDSILLKSEAGNQINLYSVKNLNNITLIYS